MAPTSPASSAAGAAPLRLVPLELIDGVGPLDGVVVADAEEGGHGLQDGGAECGD